MDDTPRAEMPFAMIPAGDFSSWLRQTRAALSAETGADVDCRDCAGCCASAYFIHIRPEETDALAHIPAHALAAAPGLPKGHMLLTHDENGRCAMLIQGRCSIYAHRPRTCRNYDCRVFSAAGIAAGGSDKQGINRRLEQWEFSYPTPRDREEAGAVRAAIAFIRDHAASFPGGRVPDNPSQLAILALKVYRVFLGKDGAPPGPAAETAGNAAETARAIIAASRAFDAGMAS